MATIKINQPISAPTQFQFGPLTIDTETNTITLSDCTIVIGENVKMEGHPTPVGGKITINFTDEHGHVFAATNADMNSDAAIHLTSL